MYPVEGQTHTQVPSTVETVLMLLFCTPVSRRITLHEMHRHEEGKQWRGGRIVAGAGLIPAAAASNCVRLRRPISLGVSGNFGGENVGILVKIRLTSSDGNEFEK